MSTFKPYPELIVDETVGPQDGFIRVITKSGKDFMVTVDGDKEDIERLVECWNACRKIAFPDAHIKASDEYTERLEQLRKDAWSRAQELEEQVRAAS
jgi:hypothetical protein